MINIKTKIKKQINYLNNEETSRTELLSKKRALIGQKYFEAKKTSAYALANEIGFFAYQSHRFKILLLYQNVQKGKE